MLAKTVDMPDWPANRFEELLDIMGDGGVSIYVNFHLTPETILFEIDPEVPIKPATIAAMNEAVTLMATDTAFNDHAKSYCANIGGAVHCVTDPAWKVRDLTPEEMAALNAEEPPRLNS